SSSRFSCSMYGRVPPITSLAVHPKIFSAARFQIWTLPLRFKRMIAWGEASIRDCRVSFAARNSCVRSCTRASNWFLISRNSRSPFCNRVSLAIREKQPLYRKDAKNIAEYAKFFQKSLSTFLIYPIEVKTYEAPAAPMIATRFISADGTVRYLLRLDDGESA